MKGITLRLTISMLLALGGSVFAMQDSSVLTVQARERIRVLADEHSYFMDIFLPEQGDVPKMAISSVPEGVKDHALLWIPRIVQQRWLPTDIESKLVALKDVKQWEKRDKKGILISERIGDFLTVAHEVSGYGIHVHEAGGELSLRVDFPQVMAVGDDPGAFVRRRLTEFLNIPDASLDELRGEVKEEAPIYYVVFFRSPPTLNNVGQRRGLWEYLAVCTDGRFFFAWVPEVEKGKRRPKPGLPDRF